MEKLELNLPVAGSKWGTTNTKYSPNSDSVDTNQLTEGSENFRTDNLGVLEKRSGGVVYNSAAFTAKCNDSYEAVFDSGVHHLLEVHDGKLYATTGDRTYTEITTGYSTSGSFEFATYQNRVYFGNGIGNPQCYDIVTSYGGVTYTFTTGKTKQMGCIVPATAPTAGTVTAGGSVPDGAHTYKITYLYFDSQESNGSTASSAKTAGTGNNTIPLSAIPVGGYGVTARKVYRDNNDGNYVLIGTIADNSTTTFSDTFSSGTTPIPSFNDLPPTFSKICVHNDRLWTAGVSGDPALLFFSNAGEPDIFDPSNYIICKGGDVITGLYPYNDRVYVFSRNAVGMILGSTRDDFRYVELTNNVGCIDNRSIQGRTIEGVPLLVWLSDKGLYGTNGSSVEYISDPIEKTVNLNIQQASVNTGYNAQSTYADFQGGTPTTGIDLETEPGSIMTINPTIDYATETEWETGVLTNVAQLNPSYPNAMRVPTRFMPAYSSGTYNGTTASGSNIVLTVTADSSGYRGINGTYYSGIIGINTNSSTLNYTKCVAKWTFARAGIITYLEAQTVTNDGLGSGCTGTYQLIIMNDVAGLPGTVQYTDPTSYSFSTTGGIRQDTITKSGLSFAVSAGQSIWVGILKSSNQPNNMGARLATTAATQVYPAYESIKLYNLNSVWADPYNIGIGKGCVKLSYTASAVPGSGSWTSPIYDTYSESVTSTLNVAATGGYPSGTSSTITVYGSDDGSTFDVSENILSLNGNSNIALNDRRYWKIVASLATNDDRVTPTLYPITMKFATTAEWVSPEIDTKEPVSFDSLVVTSTLPGGTSATITIATSDTSGSGYGSYAVLGSAVVKRYAKIKVSMATDASNIYSPNVTAVLFTWTVTGTFTSSAINTGITTPSGWNIFQASEQLNGGTLTYSLRSAASTGTLGAASWYAVTPGQFPSASLPKLQYVQWKVVVVANANDAPKTESVTVQWYKSTGTTIRAASSFYNKTYYLAAAEQGYSYNNIVIVLDQFNNWRIYRGANASTFVQFFNTLYYTDSVSFNTVNFLEGDTDAGTNITMDVRTKAFAFDDEQVLKVPRYLKVLGTNTGTTIKVYFSVDEGSTWIEMLNESGTTGGFVTSTDLKSFIHFFVPNFDGSLSTSGRTIMYRLTSTDAFPCEIEQLMAQVYKRKGKYLHV